MSFYTELQGVASDVFDEFKQGSVKLVKVTKGSGPNYNPGTPTRNKFDLSATVAGVNSKLVSDGFAQASDLLVSSAVLKDTTVGLTDFIEIDGIAHKIISDMSVPAAGVKVSWKFVVRRGG